jgi:hypothetical protein
VNLVNLCPEEAPFGFNEGARVLAHMFKDKSKTRAEYDPNSREWSRYFQNSCNEAIEALENHEYIRDLPRKHSYDPYNTSSSWGTSSSWEGPGKGKDDGKGKSKGDGKGKGKDDGKGKGKDDGKGTYLHRGPAVS